MQCPPLSVVRVEMRELRIRNVVYTQREVTLASWTDPVHRSVSPDLSKDGKDNLGPSMVT